MSTEISILIPKFTFLYAKKNDTTEPITAVFTFPVDVNISGNIREDNAAKGRALKKILTFGEEVSIFINNGKSFKKIVTPDKIRIIKNTFSLFNFFLLLFIK